MHVCVLFICVCYVLCFYLYINCNICIIYIYIYVCVCVCVCNSNLFFNPKFSLKDGHTTALVADFISSRFPINLRKSYEYVYME